MQVDTKIFEVERIVCHRAHKGKEEFLVYWKGFENPTWEPVENLLSCGDLIEQFHRQAKPIPGANPHQLIRTAKAKTVHVKMLLTRKNKHKRKLTPSSSEPDTNDKSITPPFKRKGLSESEKLIRDTLLHESKTMKPENTCLNKINGLFDCYDNNLNNNDIKPMDNNVPNKKLNGRRTVSDSYYRGRNEPSKLVLCEIDKGYMTITLNNARRHNILTTDMLDAIRNHMIKAKKNDTIKAVLFCSSGDYFCSGIDYSEFVECSDDKTYKILVNDLISCLRNFFTTWFSFTKPIVCAVNGPAFEFGASLVVGSDFSYSSAKASFDLMFNKLDLTPIGCVTHLLPKIVGRGLAHSMMYLGGHYSAATSFDRGLVLDMYGVNSFSEDIEKRMLQLATNSTHCLQATKRVVQFLQDDTIEDIYSEELKLYQQSLLSKETRKKMKDDWTMRINLYSDI